MKRPTSFSNASIKTRNRLHRPSCRRTKSNWESNTECSEAILGYIHFFCFLRAFRRAKSTVRPSGCSYASFLRTISLKERRVDSWRWFVWLFAVCTHDLARPASTHTVRNRIRLSLWYTYWPPQLIKVQATVHGIKCVLTHVGLANTHCSPRKAARQRGTDKRKVRCTH